MFDLTALPALNTAPLFPALHSSLLQLLRSLQPADWELPTLAGRWRVRDVTAHLLDGALRKLAAHRDGHALAADQPVSTYHDVLALINGLNATGVAFGARLSTRLLIDLTDETGQWLSTFVTELDPDAPALFPVAWAGELTSDNRFDTAREYTERWHHQMQIRVAVGGDRPHVLLAPAFFHPLADTTVRALPHAYRHTDAPVGTSVVLQLSGDAPLAWTVMRDSSGWRLYRGDVPTPSAKVVASPDALWQLFYNALPMDEASARLTLDGPSELVAPLLSARSVMV